MASEGSEPTNWKKRESLGSALVQIFIVGALLSAAVYFVVNKGNTKKEIAELLKDARAEAVKGNLANVKKAISTASEALEKDANSPDVNAFIAAEHADLWLQHKEAGAEAKTKEFLEKAKAADSKSGDRYGVEALQLLAAGKNKEAEDFVEDLRKKGASHARIFYAQALALKSLGNLKLAATAFRAASDKEWKDVNYASALGESQLEEGAFAVAQDTFNKAILQNAAHIRSRLGLALARVMRKQGMGDAENILKELMARESELSTPQVARATAIGAMILAQTEQYDQAITTADAALAKNGDDVWALFAKALALAGKKDPGAAAAFDTLVARAPTAPVFYFEGAHALQRAGQADAGMSLLSKYEGVFKSVKNPTADGKEEVYLDRDDRYWLARGDMFKAANKLDDAIASYDKAIEAKAANITRAYYAKGSTLLEKKEFEKALEILQDITPQDGTGSIPEAYFAMGDILFEKKEWGPGCQNYAFGLAKMKMKQEPREKLNEIITGVEKRLKAANQKDIAKLWTEELTASSSRRRPSSRRLRAARHPRTPSCRPDRPGSARRCPRSAPSRVSAPRPRAAGSAPSPVARGRTARRAAA